MSELTIIEIREIIQTIKDVYGHDFSFHAMTAFKSRLESIILKYNFGNSENLRRKLKEEKEFFDTFLFEISIPSTEMFRDPSLWRWLKEVYLPSAVTKCVGKFRIMVPCCVSGAELYSLSILLYETGLMDKVEISATCTSETAINLIRSGQYDLKKTEISRENYKRYAGDRGDFSKYYTVERYHAIMDTSLLKDVELIKALTFYEAMPQNIKLALFRNKMIYFTPGLQDKALKQIYNALAANGNLIVGVQERINLPGSFNGFEIVNESERVYRKKQLI